MEDPGSGDLHLLILLPLLQLDDVDGDLVDVPAGPDGSDASSIVLRLLHWSDSGELLFNFNDL